MGKKSAFLNEQNKSQKQRNIAFSYFSDQGTKKKARQIWKSRENKK